MRSEARDSLADERSPASRGPGLKPASRGILVLLGGIAAVWLTYQFWRLALQPGPQGAVDLRLRWVEVSTWFEGRNVYSALSNAMYPPASYLMLWPFLGWLERGPVRWLWALVTVAMLSWLVVQLVRQSGATTRRERWLVALLVLASYPVGATVGNGQLGIAVILCVVASLALFDGDLSWRRSALVGGLFLAALVKPSMAAPFFWLLLFAFGSLRPAILSCAGYAALTFAASLFQSKGPVALLRAWLRRSGEGAAWGATKGEGSIRLAEAAGASGGDAEPFLQITSVNLHSVLSYLGHGNFLMWATAATIVLLGVWVWFHRRSSLWAVAGVTALVSRFCTYHGWYDDVLLLLPLVALFRIYRCEARAKPRYRRAAAVFFAAMSVSLVAPGGVYLLPYPWNNAYVLAQTAVWLLVLVFLGLWARRSIAGSLPHTGRRAGCCDKTVAAALTHSGGEES